MEKMLDELNKLEIGFQPRNHDRLPTNKPYTSKGLYWNSNQSIVEFEKDLCIVFDAMPHAAKYKGVIFGGFVRNVMVPRATGQPSSGYKDVNFWFETKSSAESFIKEMRGKLTFNYSSSKIIAGNPVHPFERLRLYLCHIPIDIVISTEIPVNDFDVNMLTYNSREGFKSFGSVSTNSLIESIKNKVATILPGYEMPDISNERIDTMKEIGWTFNK